MSIIEQIKAEVERLLKFDKEVKTNYYIGRRDAEMELLAFLDTLQEKSEKPINPVCEGLEEELERFLVEDVDVIVDEDTEKVRIFDVDTGKGDIDITYSDLKNLARHFYELGCRRTAEKYDEIEYKRQRADVCEGLEKEIEMYFEDWDSNPNGAFFDKEGYKIGIIALKNIARHFAQWGAEHRGSSEIPNDLEEAARKYRESVPVDTTIHYCGADEDVYFANRIVDAVIFGAEWQKEQTEKRWLEDRDGCFWDGVEEGKKAMKEQMMKEAVEGEVVKDISNKLAVTAKINLDGFKFGQKVKLIIVKED